MSAETLEKLAMRENLVQALLAEGREYHEIKRTLESLTVPGGTSMIRNVTLHGLHGDPAGQGV